MKKPILTSVICAGSLAAFGQGTIDVGNLGSKTTFVQPIFQPDPATDGLVEQIGNPSTTVYPGAIYNGLANGTTIFGGLPAGAGYDIVFFYTTAASVTSLTIQDASSLMNIGTTAPLRSGPTPTSNPAGTMASIIALQLPAAQSGAAINWAFGAFSTQGGTINSWAEAISAIEDGTPGGMQIGVGDVVTGTILGGTDSAGVLHAEPTTFGGWTSFSLTGTPEPGTITLAGLGAAGLLLFRRRKYTQRHK